MLLTNKTREQKPKMLVVSLSTFLALGLVAGPQLRPLHRGAPRVPTRAGSWSTATRARLCAMTEPIAAPTDNPAPADTPYFGAELNEELRLSVQYLGGPASRQRRVRRTKRPSREERWRQSSLAYREGHMRMSSFCSFNSIDLELAIELLEQDVRWRRCGRVRVRGAWGGISSGGRTHSEEPHSCTP